MSYASNALCGRAFHEAGHAVVARYFGLTVVGIEIRDDASGKTDTVGSIDGPAAHRPDRNSLRRGGFQNYFQVPQSESCFR
jgi:Peptidase M50B-like